MSRVIERSQFLNSINDEARLHLKADIPRLKQRAALLNRATFYSIMCAIVTSLLIIVAFVSALLHLTHEYGVAILFIIALGFFLLSVIDFARETRMALHDLDHRRQGPIRKKVGTGFPSRQTQNAFCAEGPRAPPPTHNEPTNRAHSGNPAFRRPSISSFEFDCPPRAINADIVNAGSSSSTRAAAS
jgi:hypothetical protein